MNVVTIFNIRRANPRWSLFAYCEAAALALVGSFRSCWEAQSAGPECDSDRIVQDDEVEDNSAERSQQDGLRGGKMGVDGEDIKGRWISDVKVESERTHRLFTSSLLNSISTLKESNFENPRK